MCPQATEKPIKSTCARSLPVTLGVIAEVILGLTWYLALMLTLTVKTARSVKSGGRSATFLSGKLGLYIEWYHWIINIVCIINKCLHQ